MSRNFSLMLVPESGKIRRFSLSRRALATSVMGALVMLTFGIWGTYSVFHTQENLSRISQLKQTLTQTRSYHQIEIANLQNRLEAGRKQLAVFARNIGRMQARLSRLDALGSRLVEVASLDSSKFNFGLQPAYGGPRIVQSSVLDTGSLDQRVQHLNTQLSNVDTQFAAIDYLLQQKRNEHTARPHAWPSEGGWVSSRYGSRADPFTGEAALHRGVDIANRFGAPALAASRGIVIFTGKVKDFGYMVEISHGYGYVTRYAHLGSISVKVGDVVKDNELIGRIGSSGRSTGPHLHYEIHRYGRHINPDDFLPNS